MIRMKDVSFRYLNSTEGVSGIDLMVNEGECVVFTGPSGGGKTTLTRLLNALAPSFYAGTLTGTISINGKSLTQMPQYTVARQIGSVFQDPKSQFFSSELAGETAFACENYGFSAEEIRDRTDDAIVSFDLNGFRSRNLDVLSSGEKQRVAIASVYALRPDFYVCDEPTSNLDKTGSEQLAAVFKQLKAEGHTIIIAEHRLSWLHGIADRFIYVRDGRVLWERNTAEMEQLSPEERERYGLREITEKRDRNILIPTRHTDQSPTLCVKSLSCRRKKTKIFRDINLSAPAGQITAITGHNGIGKTSLALVLSGLWKEESGRVLVDGRELSARERRKQTWFSSNDTGTQFFTNSISEEVLLNMKHSEEHLEKARSLLKRLGLYRYKDVHPASLSGGQKQRLAIACGILSDRTILIFDEPTSGLDGGNMKIIADVLREAADQKKVVLVITHDDELICRCDSEISIDDCANKRKMFNAML